MFRHAVVEPDFRERTRKHIDLDGRIRIAAADGAFPG
jgi:hypothetical protein